MEARKLEIIAKTLSEKDNTKDSPYTPSIDIFTEMHQLQMIASLTQQFHEWLQTKDRAAASDTEHLLEWYLNEVCTPANKTYPDIEQDYRLYLNLFSVVVEKANETATAPISEEEFKNRIDLINFFTKWINDKKENRWSDTDNLLFWYKFNDKHQSYEGFLALAQLAAKRGYLTAEVRLTPEEYDARFKNSVETMRKLITKMFDPVVQATNYKFYNKTSDTIFNTVGQEDNTRQQLLESSSARPPKVRRV